MLIEQLQINSRYNFKLHAAAHLGAEIKQATLISMGTLALASVFDPGVASKHVQVYPSLPDGSLKDPSKLTYLTFTTQANQTIVFAYDWIIKSSIEKAMANKANLDVLINSPEDLSRIIGVLSRAGFTVQNSTIG